MRGSIIEPPPEPGAPRPPLAVRLAWFAAIAAGSAILTAAVAFLLKSLLR